MSQTTVLASSPLAPNSWLPPIAWPLSRRHKVVT